MCLFRFLVLVSLVGVAGAPLAWGVEGAEEKRPPLLVLGTVEVLLPWPCFLTRSNSHLVALAHCSMERTRTLPAGACALSK